MANIDIIELLDILYGMVNEAWSVPLGNDKCIIEREKAIEIINEIKVNLPTAIAEAQRLVSARDEFIFYNIRLVLSIVQRFSSSKDNTDDIFQVGIIGLIKSIDNFNTSLGVKFSTYAVPMIIGEIRKYLRDSTSIKVTRSTRDIAYKALQAKEKILRETNKDATIS